MTKPVFITIFLLLVLNTYSQFNIITYTGYTFSTNPIILDNIVIEDNKLNATNSLIKYGNGVNVGIGIGYDFSEKLSLNINCITQLYSKSEFGNDSYFNISRIYGNYIFVNKNIQVSPLLVYYHKLGKIKLFVKGGLNMLYSRSVLSHNFYGLQYDPSTNETYTKYYQYTYVIKGGINFGFRGAIGLQYPFNKKISLYVELMSVNTNYNFKESEVTKYLISGEDHLSSIDDVKKELENDEGLVDYSHAGILVGLIYKFNKKIIYPIRNKQNDNK